MKLRKLTSQGGTTGEEQEISQDEVLLSNANTPIYILPDDVLMEIWSYVCGDKLSHSRGVRPHQREISIPFILMISWVSSRWRNLSISAPLLWCTIRVNAVQSIEMIRAQVERSKRCPLIIKADSYYPRNYSASEMGTTRMLEKVAHVVHLVLDELDRWRVFEFDDIWGDRTYLDWFEDTILGPLQNESAPRLERLAIQIMFFGSKPRNKQGPRVLFDGGTPVLSTVRLHSVSARSNLVLLTGLTSLNLKHIPGRLTHTELHRIFIACPLLVDLTLENGVYNSELASSSETLHAPSLLSLCYANERDEPHETIGKFFSHLSAPRLKSLTLCFIRTLPFGELVDAVKATGSGSQFPVLSELHLHNLFSVDRSRCLELTHCFPSIDYLECERLLNVPLLESLVSSDKASAPREGTAWPHLRTLHMYPDTSVRDLINGRIATDCPVTKLRITKEWFLDMHPVDRKWFGDHVELQICP